MDRKTIEARGAPLTPAAFRAALEKGQGRAWLHVRDHGTAGVEDELLHACLHSLLYDAQCEDDRAGWLLEMVERSPDPGRFAAAIAAALPAAVEDRDAWQLSDLALHLARRGDPAARRALYARLEDPLNGFDGADNVIALDGLEGFLQVAEMRGRRLLADPEEWEDDWLLSLTAESCGAEAVRAALEEAASRSEAVRAYRDAVDESLRQAETPRISGAGPDLAAILRDIEAAAGTFPGRYARFGRTASQEDVDAIFARLLAETRREQRLRCLWVFRRRAVPRCDELLLRLVESEDAEIQEAACSALAGTPDPRVRVLALRLLDRPEALVRSSLRLFLAHLEAGDPARIEAALWVPEDREAVHSIAWDVLELAGAHPAASWTAGLSWVAEHNPCSNCRARALQLLLARGTAAEALLRECLHDADGEARKLAAAWIESSI